MDRLLLPGVRRELLGNWFMGRGFVGRRLLGLDGYSVAPQLLGDWLMDDRFVGRDIVGVGRSGSVASRLLAGWLLGDGLLGSNFLGICVYSNAHAYSISLGRGGGCAFAET